MNFSLLFAKISSLTYYPEFLDLLEIFNCFYFGVSNKTTFFLLLSGYQIYYGVFLLKVLLTKRSLLPSFSEIDHNSHVESKKFFANVLLSSIDTYYFKCFCTFFLPIFFIVAPGFQDKPNDNSYYFCCSNNISLYIFHIINFNLLYVLNSRNFFRFLRLHSNFKFIIYLFIIFYHLYLMSQLYPHGSILVFFSIVITNLSKEN